MISRYLPFFSFCRSELIGVLKKIMKSYETSTTTLRAILAHPSLERSSVDRTMEALAEANADAKDLDDAIRLGGDVTLAIEDSVDDAELEEEWKAMVRDLEAADKPKAMDSTATKLDEISKTPVDVPSPPTPAKPVLSLP